MFMPYVPPIFQDGDVLMASHLNLVTEQVANNYKIAAEQLNIAKKKGQIYIYVKLNSAELKDYELQLLRKPVGGYNSSGVWRIADDIGYSSLQKHEPLIYPAAPSWMPNNGKFQYKWNFTESDCISVSGEERLYRICINPKSWLVDNLKPDRVDGFQMSASSEVGTRTNDINLIGMPQGKSMQRLLPFKFQLVKNDTVVAVSHQILYVGCGYDYGAGGHPPDPCQLAKRSNKKAQLTGTIIRIR